MRKDDFRSELNIKVGPDEALMLESATANCAEITCKDRWSFYSGWGLCQNFISGRALGAVIPE